MKVGINIYLERDQKEMLDKISDQKDISKSEIMRKAFNQYLIKENVKNEK